MIVGARPATIGSRGLSAAEARALRAKYGANELVPARRKAGSLARFLKPFADPMTVLLLVAGGTYLALGDRFDAIVALIALAPVTLVTVVLEGRAERALERLRRLTAPVAEVWRDGALTTIPADEVVPGDAVAVKEGDIVPADGDLVDGTQLSVDESSLTGESVPAEKTAAEDGGASKLFAGTTVLSGRGTFVVSAIGLSTRYGAIGRLVAAASQPATPMQKVIGRLVRKLAIFAVALCFLVAAVEAWRGHSFAIGVIAGVSLAMAAIPEEFPMVYALYLALGAWRLSRDNALIRKLTSVETLGATTVICTDKTGTLTTGRMEVASIHQADVQSGERALWEAALLACEPHPFDPLEQAIVRAALQRGIDVDALHRGTLLRDYPFETGTKTVTHVWSAHGHTGAFAKGAIEGILAKSTATAAARDSAVAMNERFGASGMRVLAVAAGDAQANASSREEDERALALVGLIGFSDPVREGVASTIEECRRAGIRVIIVTGDHASTARAVASQLGFGSDIAPVIATGDEIDAADDDGLVELAQRATIFARTRPDQKHRLVKALQRCGHVVAMTGDGTNDAPALREADIGIAMGVRGTEVAREAADLVLLDDDFSTIVRAVRDGRRIFDNLRKAFGYLIAFHAPLLLGAFAMPLIGVPLLLLPVHLVWLEVIVHPTSSLVFEADTGANDIMRRPPRRKDEELLPSGTIVRATVNGCVLAVGVIGLYLRQLAYGVPEDAARAAAIAALIIGQGVLVLLERRPAAPVWRAFEGSSAILPIVLIATVGSVVAAIEIPQAAAVLRLAQLGASGWAIAVSTGLVFTLWREPFKAMRSRARGASPNRPKGA